MPSTEQMIGRIALLLEQRLRLRGPTLAARLAQGAARRLPRAVRAAARRLAEAEAMAGHPRLAVQLDQARVQADYDTCLRYLSGLGRSDRRIAFLTEVALSSLLGLAAAAGLFFAVARWRGLL